MTELEQAWPGRSMTTADGQLFVRDTGESDLPVVVLLHGLGGSADEWWPVASRLRNEFRVVAFDQRGQGRSTSTPKDFSRAAFIRDVAAIIDDLNCGPGLLVGQSMGAHTALLAGAHHPGLIERLVLVEGGLGGEGPTATDGVIAWFRRWPVPFANATDAAEWFGRHGFSPAAAKSWAATLQETPSGLVPRFSPESLHTQLLAVHERSRETEWEAIQCPVLLITGANGLVPQREIQTMVAANPHASTVEVPEAGHDVHLDAPDETAWLIRGGDLSEFFPPQPG